MKLWLALLLLPLPAASQSRLAVAASNSKDYVVGAKLPPSGLFFQESGQWKHVGYNLPFLVALDFDSADPATIYLAAGNGLFRTKNGEDWKQLTGSDVTELRDLAIDRSNIYFAYCHGIRASHDRGKTWEELAGNLHRKFTEAIRIDRSQPQRLVIGNEEGVFRSDDAGSNWQFAGAAGVQILRIEQSPYDPCLWLAATQGAGLFRSTDCAKTFESVGRVGFGRNLYSIAFDPTDEKRIAIAGWGPGVTLSEDGGKTWQSRNSGLPRPDVWSVIFDPQHSGRLYASVQEEALYVSNDAGKHWEVSGLEGSAVWRMRFIP